MPFSRPLLAAFVLALPLRLAAHDFWLEPDAFFGAPGDTVTLRLFVGMNLQPLEEKEFQLDRTAQCLLVTAMGRRDLRGVLPEGKKPFAQVELGRAGTQLVAVERRPADIVLEADKFTAYLKEEGLDYIVAERARLGESGRPGRERYSRFLKCYLRAGDAPEAVVPAASLRLELAPEMRADRAMQVGDELRVRVDFEGAPLPRAVLFAAVRPPGGAAVTQRLVTNDEGWVAIKLTTPGLWALRLVHMRRAPVGDPTADWESFWAACTFGVR